MTDYSAWRDEAVRMGARDMHIAAPELVELIDELSSLRAQVKPAKAARNDYPPAFEEVWAMYPISRQGVKMKAFKAWNVWIKRGVEPAEIANGLRKYLAHAKATRKAEQYLSLAATFFGPDEHFATDWTAQANAQKGKLSGSIGKQDYSAGVGPDGSF